MKMRYLIIGDTHGCFEELKNLIAKAKESGFDPYLNPQDKFVFLGDCVDRGPHNDKTLEFVCNSVLAGMALSVLGNHEQKLMRFLKGNDVHLKNGLEITVEQIENREDSENLKKIAFSVLSNLPDYLVLDEGKLVCVHAGIQDRMLSWSKSDKFMKRFCIYGDITGDMDEHGFPIRLDWTLKRDVTDSSPLIVYGHMPQKDVYINNKTYNIDCGCVFGNKLVGLLYPDLTLIEVPAIKEYWEYKDCKFKKEVV